MPMIVVLHDNIYDHEGNKCLRGEAHDWPQDLIDEVIRGDEEAGRPTRITVIEEKRKPGRPKKTDEAA